MHIYTKVEFEWEMCFGSNRSSEVIRFLQWHNETLLSFTHKQNYTQAMH